MSREPMYFLGKCVDELLTRNKDYIFKKHSRSYGFRISSIIYMISVKSYQKPSNRPIIITKYYTSQGLVITQQNRLKNT